jgi:hypothetical protein
LQVKAHPAHLGSIVSSHDPEAPHRRRQIRRLRASSVDEERSTLFFERMTLAAPHGAVARKKFEQLPHLDLGAVLRRQARKAMLALSAASGAAEAHDNIGI